MSINKIIKVLELAIVGIAVFALSFLGAFFYLKMGDLGKISFDSVKKSIPKLFVVESGSMEPVIKTGSIVITEPSDIYAQNDVISFKSGKKVITHRIMYRSFPDGVNAAATYQTSGDANEDFDPFVVKQEQVVGKVVYDIPYLGYVANFAKQPYGFILLVIVPATIVIYEELKSLLGQVYISFLDHIKKKKKKEGVMPVRSKKNRKGMFLLSRTSVLIPVFGAIFVFTGLAASYFSDWETSAGNVMQAGEWGPKIAQTLVIHEVLPLSNCKLGNTTAQWIEIYNGYSTSVNLKDFSIRDGDGNKVALVNAGNIILGPGEFALLSHDNSIWNGCYSDNNVITANFGTGDLNLNTGILELLDSNDAVIDIVKWGGSGDPQPQLNESIERVALGQDTAIGTSWAPGDFAVQCPPTPGFWQATTGGCQVVINEINWAGSHLSGTNGEIDEWIELRNKSISSVNLSGWSIEGAITGSGSLNITSGTINSLGFYLISNFDKTISRINVDPDFVTTTIQLNNTGGAQYILRDNHGNIVDIADDGNGVPLAGSNSVPKKSMERKDPPGDGTLAGSWQSASTHTNMDGSTVTDEFGTPRAQNGI